MANSSSSSAGGGIGFAGLLGVLFVALKLLKIITWPWLWVLSPFWIPWAIVLGVVIVVFVIWLIVGAVQSPRTSKKGRSRAF